MTDLNAEPRFTALSNQASLGNISRCLFTKPPSLRMWGHISGTVCYLKKCLPKELVKAGCLKRRFNRAVGTVLFPGANMHSFAPPLSWRGLGVQEFGLKCMKVWKCHCTDNPWDPCASCRQTLETSVWFLCNRGCKTPFWRAQVCVGMLWDGNPAAVHRHSLLKWCCSFWRQLSVWSRRLGSLPAKSSTSWEDEKDLVPTAVKAACQWYHWKQKCCETNSN